MIMQANQVHSLSFSTYSSCRLTDIAARVVEECRNDSELNDFYDEDLRAASDVYRDESVVEERFVVELDEQARFEEVKGGEGEKEEEFEFSFNCRAIEASPISADDIFYNGQIKPCYPLFNTDLLLDIDDGSRIESVVVNKPRRLSLGKLMTEDRDHSPSCSSSDADELEGLAPGTYCVWKPKTEQESLANRKKSSSTGALSKRWRFRDLMSRSNSDGKDAFIVFPSSSKSKKNEDKLEKSVSFNHGKFTGIPKMSRVSGVTEIPAESTEMKADEKRRSYHLPYKHDLFGLFANVNGLSRNLHPF